MLWLLLLLVLLEMGTHIRCIAKHESDYVCVKGGAKMKVDVGELMMVYVGCCCFSRKCVFVGMCLLNSSPHRCLCTIVLRRRLSPTVAGAMVGCPSCRPRLLRLLHFRFRSVASVPPGFGDHRQTCVYRLLLQVRGVAEEGKRNYY